VIKLVVGQPVDATRRKADHDTPPAASATTRRRHRDPDQARKRAEPHADARRTAGTDRRGRRRTQRIGPGVTAGVRQMLSRHPPRGRHSAKITNVPPAIKPVTRPPRP